MQEEARARAEAQAKAAAEQKRKQQVCCSNTYLQPPAWHGMLL
jgi:hypothetical protein